MELIKHTIQKGDFKEISLTVNPFEIKRLPDGCFLSTNVPSISLLDKNLKNIDETIIPDCFAFGCAISNEDIYIADNFKHCIYMIDIVKEGEKKKLQKENHLARKVVARINLEVLMPFSVMMDIYL